MFHFILIPSTSVNEIDLFKSSFRHPCYNKPNPDLRDKYDGNGAEMNNQTIEPSSEAAFRILLLYALSKLGAPISREEFAPILLSSGGSWIDLQLRTDALIEDGLARDENGEISITADGVEVLNVYRDKLPDTSLTAVDEYMNTHRSRLRDRLYIKAAFEQLGAGYLVRLSMAESGQTLLSLEFDTPTRDQAVAVCENWKANPQKIYSEVIRILTT